MPLTVEAMADFELFENGRWRPVVFVTCEAQLCATTLFVLDRRALAGLLNAIGRAQDTERVVMLTS